MSSAVLGGFLLAPVAASWLLWRALSHPHLGAEQLHELATEDLPVVRANLARNPNTPAGGLERLAENLDERVRRTARILLERRARRGRE